VLALALRQQNECASFLDGTLSLAGRRRRKGLTRRERRDLERSVARAGVAYEGALRRLRRRRVPEEIEAIVACARAIAEPFTGETMERRRRADEIAARPDVEAECRAAALRAYEAERSRERYFGWEQDKFVEYFTWGWMEARCGRLRTYNGYASAPPSLGYEAGWNAYALELFRELEAVALPRSPGLVPSPVAISVQGELFAGVAAALLPVA
jgi:hypothetical protein